MMKANKAHRLAIKSKIERSKFFSLCWYLEIMSSCAMLYCLISDSMISFSLPSTLSKEDPISQFHFDLFDGSFKDYRTGKYNDGRDD